MNMEDELIKVIEDRDTTILLRNEKIKEQEKELAEQDKKLAEQKLLLGNAVRRMLSQGMDAATVASLLGLSEEEVCSYRQ